MKTQAITIAAIIMTAAASGAAALPDHAGTDEDSIAFYQQLANRVLKNLQQEADAISRIKDPEPASASWQIVREIKTRLWLQLLDRLDLTSDPNFDFSRMPTLNVAPPDRQYPAGVSPEVITNPLVRPQYENAIRQNSELAVRLNLKLGLERLNVSFTNSALRYLKSAYIRTPEDAKALTDYLQAITTPERKAQIRDQLRNILDAAKNTLAPAGPPSFSLASEYEVRGSICQSIGPLEHSNQFTVYVRGRGWLIKTIENETNGSVLERQVGSADGSEIYETSVPLQDATNAPDARAGRRLPPYNIARITTTGIPVGQLGTDLFAHLWLMFASGAYWSAQHTNWLTPVYDFNACAALNPSLKVPATWGLLGPGSLPREVRYMGAGGRVAALYSVAGTTNIGGVLLPNEFAFDRYEPRYPEKRVWAVVASVSAVCSLPSLIPVPADRTIVIDRRLSGVLPDYLNPTPGKWLTIAEAQRLAEARQDQQARARGELER
jgi:hypothetical protein